MLAIAMSRRTWHVERDDMAKFWLAPVRLERNNDFPRHEVNKIEDLSR